MAEKESLQQSAELKIVGMEQPGSSTASGDQETHEKTTAKLDKLMAEGHKLMLAQSFDDASVSLCEAVELASKFFGDFSPQSFMPLFNYGKSLIEVARLESLPVRPPVDTDETDDEDDDQIEEEQNDDGSGREDNESAPEGNGQQNTGEANRNGEVKVLEGEEEGDEEDIQIAWENLEVARKICENQMKDDNQTDLWTERKADVLVALGDCMTVSENFPCALEEFTKALAIRKALFGDVDRRIAEMYFWMGRTHKLMNDFKAAAEHFESAKKVLEALVTAKAKELEEKGQKTCVNLCHELEELKDALKGVEENVRDAVDSIEQQRKHDEAMKAMLQPFVIQALSAKGITAEANDITGMLKKKVMKRPLGETVSDIQRDTKTSKMEMNNENGEEGRKTNDCGKKNGN